MNNWIRWVVGYVFIISGATKFLSTGFMDFFIQVGVPYPQITFFLVALCEIGCGACIAGKFAVKQTAAILMVIMIGALYFVKLPILIHDGLLQFAFDARLDVTMLIILTLLYRQKGTFFSS